MEGVAALIAADHDGPGYMSDEIPFPCGSTRPRSNTGLEGSSSDEDSSNGFAESSTSSTRRITKKVGLEMLTLLGVNLSHHIAPTNHVRTIQPPIEAMQESKEMNVMIILNVMISNMMILLNI